MTSSKNMEDLAQFMVSQDLFLEDVSDRTVDLDVPESVVQYLRGNIGVPPGRFPELLEPKVLKSLNPRYGGGISQSQIG